MSRSGCLLLLAFALAVIAGCGSSGRQTGPVQKHTAPVLRLRGGPPTHVVVIVMENTEYDELINRSQAGYVNRLARGSALATRMFAISHPSLPNYLALTGGSTFGISSDCTDCPVAATSLVDQLERAHLSWKAYMEDVPSRCYAGAGAGGYVKKHNPFAYFTPVVSEPGRCQRIVGLGELSSDEQAGSLPAFAWISPNLCHDMHDCEIRTGDRFLARLVPPLLRALGRRGLLILTWDEGSSDDGCCARAAGGHVATILAGGLARAGARLQTPVDHYSVLQMLEDLFGLPRLREASCACTPSLAPLLNGP